MFTANIRSKVHVLFMQDQKVYHILLGTFMFELTMNDASCKRREERGEEREAVRIVPGYR